MMLDIPSHLPAESEEIYQGFLRRSLATRDMLRHMVEQYLGVIGSVLEDHTSHAWSVANLVAKGLLELITTCTQEQLSHVQAAALYFASSEDAVPDVDSDQGFDDDARVFNAVCRWLGRGELEVTI